MKFCESKFIACKDLSSYGAFSVDDTVQFRLSIPRKCGAVGACMHIFGEGIKDKSYRRLDFKWDSIELANDIYACNVDMSQIGVGLYYYKYEVFSKESFCLGEGRDVGHLSVIDGNESLIQLLIHNEKSESAKSLRGGVMYHIFVDRFKKSGKCAIKPTAVANEDWYNGIPQFASVPGGYVENNMFFGGDIYGIIEKLDYIKELGVNCLYLSPVFDAYSNHKYDTGDYMTVDSSFGSDEALDELIRQAEKRGMHIILDGVFNHTGSDSIYFNKNGTYDSVGAYQSKNSKYYEWYNFKSYPDLYECWWGVKILPRVNSNCESYQNYILGDGGVIEKWMKKGIFGFRLDVADELSDGFLKRLNKKLKSINPQGVIYGEVWEDASNKIAYSDRKEYFLGNELDSVMNYPLREAIIGYIKQGDYNLFSNTCKILYSHYPKHNADLLMNLLGTHDTERILTVLGGDSSDGLSNAELSVKKMTSMQRKKAIKLLKLAYTIVATVPGIPCIYYGDEAGMEGYRDPFNRLPYPWGKEEKELVDFYKKIGKIRVNEPLFMDGEFKIVECNEDILSFTRYNENELILVVVNRSENKYTLKSNTAFKNCDTGKKISVINAFSAHILKCKKDSKTVSIQFDKN